SGSFSWTRPYFILIGDTGIALGNVSGTFAGSDYFTGTRTSSTNTNGHTFFYYQATRAGARLPLGWAAASAGVGYAIQYWTIDLSMNAPVAGDA
ncbi:hypothetical protein, partial [Salmonella sp. M9-2]|uniref:hypothetical protein n=1 Tax=Salmonella sp. M9-2 TaxID=3240317 RepID=UPI00352AAB1C